MSTVKNIGFYCYFVQACTLVHAYRAARARVPSLRTPEPRCAGLRLASYEQP